MKYYKFKGNWYNKLAHRHLTIIFSNCLFVDGRDNSWAKILLVAETPQIVVESPQTGSVT